MAALGHIAKPYKTILPISCSPPTSSEEMGYFTLLARVANTFNAGKISLVLSPFAFLAHSYLKP